jgi:putative ABC transport system ATP-binding protein
VFADEPTGNLDSHASVEILEFMRRAVREFGQTIVMVTHDPTAASYADRVVFLADGQIVDQMTEPTAQRILDRMKRLGN